MSLTTRVGLLAGASALTLTGASFGSQTATETSTESLRAEIDALRAQVARLSADENWLTDQRSQEIRSLVQDVLADADTRASLLQSGMTAGYDDGFVLGSTDGNFSLKMNGVIQFRFVFNNQDNGPGFAPGYLDIPEIYDTLDAFYEAATADGITEAELAVIQDEAELYLSQFMATPDDNRWGFENTRTRLIFSGNVVSPAWTYFIQGDFDRTGGGFGLLDAYIGHDCGSGWTAMMGQFKAPVLREELVWSWDQLAVERSVVGQFFAAGRVQGIAANYKGDQFQVTFSYNDGAASANTPALGYDTEWAFSGRGEVLLAGNWDQFTDFTSWQGEEFGAMVGFAGHYESAEYGTSADNELQTFLGTIDASLEFGGANLFGALMYRNLDDDGFIELDQYGVVIQGGFFLNEDWELFGRYEWADLDIGVDDTSIFTIGLTRYWAGNGLKWTTDIGYGLNPVAFPAGNTGYRQDTYATIDEDGILDTPEDGQVVFRTQLQLTF